MALQQVDGCFPAVAPAVAGVAASARPAVPAVARAPREPEPL
jgi:hypothetical protein